MDFFLQTKAINSLVEIYPMDFNWVGAEALAMQYAMMDMKQIATEENSR